MLYRCIGEIQRGDSPMSRYAWNWAPATLEQHQARLNEAAGPDEWGRCGYRVNYCIAIGVDTPDERVDLYPASSVEPDAERARRERKGDFWEHKTVEQLADEQGVAPITDIAELHGIFPNEESEGGSVTKGDHDTPPR